MLGAAAVAWMLACQVPSTRSDLPPSGWSRTSVNGRELRMAWPIQGAVEALQSVPPVGESGRRRSWRGRERQGQLQ